MVTPPPPRETVTHWGGGLQGEGGGEYLKPIDGAPVNERAR